MRESGSLSARLMSFEDPNLPQIPHSARGSGNIKPNREAFTNNEKIKVYSKKLAKIVSSTTSTAVAANRTPNPKKKTKAANQNSVVSV